MKKEYFKPVLLRWILTISLISLGIVVLFSTGVASQINEVDFTKISFAILGTFILFSLRTGKLTYDICKLHNLSKSDAIIIKYIILHILNIKIPLIISCVINTKTK